MSTPGSPTYTYVSPSVDPAEVGFHTITLQVQDSSDNSIIYAEYSLNFRVLHPSLTNTTLTNSDPLTCYDDIFPLTFAPTGIDNFRVKSFGVDEATEHLYFGGSYEIASADK